MAMLGLHFCTKAFSGCGDQGPLFIAVRGPLTIAASLVAEHRLQTRRLSSCASRAQLLRGMWDLPRPGLEPCPLHWQADSQPLRHQGSPIHYFKIADLFFYLCSGFRSCVPASIKKLNYINLNNFVEFEHQFRSMNYLVLLSSVTRSCQQYYREAKGIIGLHIFQRPEMYY